MNRRNFVKGLFALPVTLAVVDASIAAKTFFRPKPDYAKLVEKQAPITEWQPNTAYSVGDRIIVGNSVRTVTYEGTSGDIWLDNQRRLGGTQVSGTMVSDTVK